jgi:hypothetical protein
MYLYIKDHVCALMMKILPLFKALSVAILLSALLLIVYSWNRDTPGRQVREGSSLYQLSWGHLGHLRSHVFHSTHSTVTSVEESTPPKKETQRKANKENATVLHYSRKKAQVSPPQLTDAQALLNSTKYSKPHIHDSLSTEVLGRIRVFLFFVGHARSGHRIIGSLLDAHPRIFISHEFNLFNQFSVIDKSQNLTWKENLHNLIYGKNTDLRQSRSDLKVDGLWQGKFIEVIGYKNGDTTARAYYEDSKIFLRNYQKLKSEVSVPLRIIHTLRNPFDIVSTSVVINSVNKARFKELKRVFASNSSHTGVERRYTIHNKPLVYGHINMFFKRIDAVMKLIKMFGRENVLDVHNYDLVSNPRATLSKILNFLGVAATDHYLDTCAAKVKSPSRSRNMVVWTPELILEMEDRMFNFEVFDRYSFIDD